MQPGDTVNEGDPVIEAETDKSTQEIYAAESGIVAKLLADEGQTVECYSDIMVLVDEGVEYKGRRRPLRQWGRAKGAGFCSRSFCAGLRSGACRGPGRRRGRDAREDFTPREKNCAGKWNRFPAGFPGRAGWTDRKS